MKTRPCPYCKKDMAGTRNRACCDDPECREKYQKDIADRRRETERGRRLAEKAAILAERPIYCDHCGSAFDVDDDQRLPVCRKPECREWWKTERVRRKKAQLAEANRRNPERRRGIVPEPTILMPGDFSHAEYLKRQREIKKPNGRFCQRCRKPLTGNYRQVCPECKEKRDHMAEVVRCDGNWGYETAIDWMRF